MIVIQDFFSKINITPYKLTSKTNSQYFNIFSNRKFLILFCFIFFSSFSNLIAANSLFDKVLRVLKNEIKTTSVIGPEQSACNPTSGCIGGFTFSDLDSNGTNNTADLGIAGVRVNIYDCNNTLVGTTFSDSNGDWQLCSLDNNETYRIEFVLSNSLSNNYSPSHIGANNGSEVQFSQPNNCVEFGLAPRDPCVANSLLVTSCYNFGGYNGQYKDNDAFVGVMTNKIDDPNTNATQNVVHYANHEHIGTTFGLAVNKTTKKAYVAAYLKRHAGFGPGGTGAIYEIDLNNVNPTTVFADLNTIYGANTAGANTHDYSESSTCIDASGNMTNFACWFNDVDSWNKVGRTSLGDMEISDDESTLYVMNLEDRNIYQIDLQNPGAVQPTFPFPLNQATDPNVILKPRDPAYDMRPFGLKYHNGLLYVAAIDSEQSRDRDNICCSNSPAVVYVYSLNPATGAWTFVLQESIQKGGTIHKFFHWRDDFKDNYRDNNQTMPVDIEFDGEDIILGLRDVASDQYGSEAGKPIAGDGTLLVYESRAGDIIRFCYDSSSNSYNFESNGSCGGVTTSGAGLGVGWPEATTPRGSYYSGDYFNAAHQNTGLGGIWLSPSDNRVYSVVYDAMVVFDAGIKALDNTTGLTREVYVLVPDTRANGGFGKTAGLGDLEAACPILPLEIGNYVWHDTEENGLQDGCENGISDLTVQLYDRNGLLVGLDKTNSLGQYYFSKENVDTTGITVNGSGLATANTYWSGMSYSSQYFIVFGNGQFTNGELTIGDDKYNITPMNNAGSRDNIDSDIDGNNLTSGSLGSRPNGLPFIDIITDVTGSGIHKYDMGLITVPRYSLGNQIFQDINNNGNLDGSDTGINGVQVRLLNSDGSIYDSDPDTGGTQALNVTTANGGYYRFDELPAGDYIIEVLAANFNSGNNLENYTSSTGTSQETNPNSNGDNNDNGLDAAVGGGIRSGIITLGNIEPTNEGEPASYNSGSVTGTAAVDNLSNLTVDFGFFTCDITANALAGTSICIGEETVISATASGSGFPYLYNWDNGIGNGQSRTVSPLTSTTYNLTVTDNYGCTAFDNVVITVLPATNPICSDCVDPADADGDGVCASEDCDDNDPSLPADVGSSCDDGNNFTTDDEIQQDSCTCLGNYIPCSTNLNVEILQPSYNNNGTVSNLSDDTFTISIRILGNGSGWLANGQTGSYGQTVTFGPYPVDATGITFDVLDQDNPNCNENVSVNIASCIESGVCTCCN
jgi:hypothetical protein